MEFQVGNIICAIIFVIEIMFFYSMFFKKREMNYIKFGFFYLVATTLSVGKMCFDISPKLNLCMSLCLCALMAIVFYKGNIITRIMAAAIFMVIAMLSEILAQYLIELVLGISYNDITVNSQLVFAPLSIAIIIMILLYTKKIYKKQLSNVPLKYLIPTMLTPIVSIAIILMVDKIIAVSNGLGEKLILQLVVMLLYVSFITFDFIESYSNKIQLELAREIIEKDRENYKILEENEKELKDLRHDIRNHMQVIKNLKSNEEYINDSIEQYIDELQNAVDKMTSVSYTGNETLDSVLNIKGRRAKVLNIKYFVKYNILENINIRDIDITTILCNALDNAIEGAEKTNEPSIVIYIESNEENIQFLIENTANEVLISDGELETTKPDKRNHGRGMNNIKECVKKYDGSIRVDYEDGIFVLDINIKNKKDVIHD
ncbi:MAG: GHKL domain-containing protein [Clostridia bacterium]|nr:GHKL domain-containing protein [Clostridia bacterium]MCI9086543.1 GHKL domain-containing protein [Clostridia bacterium]